VKFDILLVVVPIPVISGGVTLVILHSLFCSKQKPSSTPPVAPSRAENRA
jgi:hypothetical protein